MTFKAVEVWRGERVESAHELALSVRRGDGAPVFEWGDANARVYPRSSIKIIQAMPLVMSGAVETFQLDDRMLALACASHSGEPEHAMLAAEMLERGGLSVDDLECGAHAPSRKSAMCDLAAHGEKPSPLHNNCSGKHAGMLLYAKHKGYPTSGYVQPDHPVQKDIRTLLAKIIGEPVAETEAATDGCSVPTYASHLDALALGFARLGTGDSLTEQENAAAQRLRQAVANHPFYVAGTGRFDTRVMQMFGERVFIKTGAEGVYCGFFPELKTGFALKVLDGATRAAECVTANLIAALLSLAAGEKQSLAPLCAPVLRNHRNIDVGLIQLNKAFAEALKKNHAT